MFIKLKPFFSYFYTLINNQPINNLIFLMFKRKVKRLYRLSKDYFRLKSDFIQRWHDRLKHLKLRALKRLVYYTRNMKI